MIWTILMNILHLTFDGVLASFDGVKIKQKIRLYNTTTYSKLKLKTSNMTLH